MTASIKIALSSDHAAIALRQTIADHIAAQGFEVLDIGPTTPESTHYPKHGEAAAQLVASGECQLGIILCGTGQGIMMAANKVPGIRAATAHDSYSVERSVLSNNAQVLAFGQRVIGEYADGQSWAENFNADGSSQYVQDGELTSGKMHFEGKRLCFVYDPQDMIGGCFEIWPRGKNCFDFYARPDSGLPAGLDDKRFGRGWDARAWIDGEPATCETEHIS